jgi:hypothetical protein
MNAVRIHLMLSGSIRHGELRAGAVPAGGEAGESGEAGGNQ